jgi:hypothetical protein
MDKRKKLKKPTFQDVPRFQIKAMPTDHGKSKPIFSFYHMRYGKTYCLSKCSPEAKSHLATTLLQLSQKPWDEICSTYRKTFGFEKMPIENFNATVFPEIVTPDVKSLMVFSYSHGGRVAGIQQENIFHILLVGDDIYPH